MQDWYSFLKLGVPSTAMACFEWWAFEVIAIFAGVLGVTELSAQVVIVNIMGMVFMIPLGIQFAASSLVGNQVGKNCPEQAQRYAVCSVLFGVSAVSLLMVSFFLVPRSIATIFTKDEATVAIVVDTLTVLSLFLFFDAIHGVQSGNVRALGLQKYASVTTLVAYYGIGLPFALHFGFTKELGVKGFWLGYFISLVILDLIVAAIVITADWAPNVLLPGPLIRRAHTFLDDDDDFQLSSPVRR
jgi:MATE family multidrug resistance protein